METHFEPFVHLAELGPDRALIAWGGFWFRREDAAERWEIVDDSELAARDRGRRESTGARSEPYGEAVVEVLDGSGAVASAVRVDDVNHAWVDGLRPDTAYRYRIRVDGQEWAAGERWDWGPVPRGGLDLRPGGRTYDLSFRTFPDPGISAPLDFVVMGDYGVGVAVDLESSRRQRRVAEVLARLVAVAEGRPATSEAAVGAVADVVTRLGVAPGELRLLDGSGLARGAAVSPAALARLLTLAISPEHPELRPLLTGLPVAGFTGTLSERFPATGSGAGAVRAKTGTLTGVSALAGTVRDAKGRVLVFAVLADEVPAGATKRARAALDRFAGTLASCGCP